MENLLTLVLIVIIFVAAYLFLYFFFASKQKNQDLKIARLLEERSALQKEIEDSLSVPEESKTSKSGLVFEQTKKIESLEAEVLRQKKRIKELKLVAQSATMAQQDFLSNVTTEITTPLHFVLRDSTLLEKKAKDDVSVSAIQNIKDNSNFLLALLNDIVDLSKMQAKTFEIEENVVDIHYLISSLIEKKQDIAEKKSLLLTFEIDEKLPSFLILDAPKVENILENLLDNAIKYTQDGYVKVNVLVDSVDIPANTLNMSFYIEDTGGGIAQEFQDKVFSVFERVDKTEDTSSQTVGLGLSIDKKIALLMGGDITFKSEDSKGSVFRFVLRDVEMALVSSGEEGETELVDFSLLREGAQVMLVAEYNKNYQTVADAFESSKVQFFGYSDFREAMQILRKENIDLLFIDVEILNNDDAAVSKVLSSTTKAAIVPLVTSRIKDIDFTQSPLKPSGYLKKPLLKSELFKISLRLLNG